MKEYATPFSMLHAVSLLSHSSRLEKFNQAIKQNVKEGDFVVDIGTGTGVLAMMAARAGAGRVVAIDVNEESIAYAQSAATMNSLEDKIEFRRCHFKDYAPSERADVVVCEMLSSMMLIEQQVPAAIHAQEKIMKEGGIMLPASATIFALPVECEGIWKRFNPVELKFPKVAQTASRGDCRDLSDLAKVAEFDFTSALRNGINRRLEFKIIEEGNIHGILAMFEAKLTEVIRLSMEEGWRELFLPLEQPVKVSRGDEVSVLLEYDPGAFDSLRLEVSV